MPKKDKETKELKIESVPSSKPLAIADIRKVATRPTPEQVYSLTEQYIKELDSTGKPPSLARYALLFGTSLNTLREWSKEIKELDQTLTYIKTLQEAELEEKALTNKFNPNFATFLLKSKHGYKDQASTFVQNNLGIGGEWLTNALQELKAPSNTGNTGKED